jgi:hypothetical protein
MALLNSFKVQLLTANGGKVHKFELSATTHWQNNL